MSPKSLINLLRGWPAPSMLPAAALQRAVDRILSNPAVAKTALAYGPDLGYQPLREELARWLGRSYGVSPDHDRICITGGASQSLACILQSYTDPIVTRAIWLAAPCYFLACPIFEDAGFGRRMRAVPEDAHGIDLDKLEQGFRAVDRDSDDSSSEAVSLVEIGPVARLLLTRHPEQLKRPAFRKIFKHVVYVVPTCSNPTGLSMPLSRRKELVSLARRYDALVISDDVYDFLQWPASGALWKTTPSTHMPLLPRLSDIDDELHKTTSTDTNGQDFGNTVSNGSFSKLVGPGIRTGWIDAKPAFALGLSKTGSSRSGGAPSQIGAAIMHEMLASGDLYRHIDTVSNPTLQRRHRLIQEAIETHLQPLGLTVVSENLRGSGVYGGYFVWLTLPKGINCDDLAVAAKEANLIIGAGSLCRVRAFSSAPNTTRASNDACIEFNDKIRLSFSWEPEDMIVEGVQRLAEVIRDLKVVRVQRK